MICVGLPSCVRSCCLSCFCPVPVTAVFEAEGLLLHEFGTVLTCSLHFFQVLEKQTLAFFLILLSSNGPRRPLAAPRGPWSWPQLLGAPFQCWLSQPRGRAHVAPTRVWLGPWRRCGASLPTEPGPQNRTCAHSGASPHGTPRFSL